MKKVFMTGGTGFFGKSILSMLRRGALPGYALTILSRDPEGFLAENPEFYGLKAVSFLRGDVRDFEFPKEHFDAVLHAATPAVTTLAPGVQRDLILRGTERALAFAKSCGAARFLLTSSGAVYGPQEPEMAHLDETAPCRPVTEYGIAKLEAEKMCLASGIPALLPRCFAFTGPYLNRDIHFAVGNFIRDALAGQPIVIQGDGTPFRSYLYADDLAVWLFAILERGEAGMPYNVGSERAVSILELAQTVKRVLKSAGTIELRQTPRPGVPPSRYVPSTKRIRAMLKVSENYTLEEAIRLSAKREKGGL